MLLFDYEVVTDSFRAILNLPSIFLNFYPPCLFIFFFFFGLSGIFFKNMQTNILFYLHCCKIILIFAYY